LTIVRHSERVKRIVLAVAAFALALPAATASADPAPAFRDTVLPAHDRALQSASLDGYWGGPTTAASGETVAVYVSTDYPEDPAVTQKWADYLSSLVHGSELSTVEVRFDSSRQVRRLCGRLALACYSPSTHAIVVPFDQSPDGPSPESILAHEYGHHVAASRLNTPWDANDYGPKRWATAAGVCQKAQAGTLFPGDEGENYAFNPAEIFAEDYRLLNEQRLGLPISAWEIVDQSVQPDQTVLDALAQDVTDPWAGQRTLTYSGSFRKGSTARPRAFVIQTPLDGSVEARIASPKGTAFKLRLNGHPSSFTNVCGSRTVTATVSRVKGYGAFKLIASVP
jgi:hypothetical protein